MTNPSPLTWTKNALIPYSVSAVASLAGSLLAGWLFKQYGILLWFLPGLCAALLLGLFSRKSGFVFAIPMTLFVLLSSFGSQFYFEFQIQTLTAARYQFSRLNGLHYLVHAIGAFTIFAECVSIRWIPIRSYTSDQEHSPFKLTVLPCIVGVVSPVLSIFLVAWLKQNYNVFGVTFVGLITCITLSWFPKKESLIRGILLALVTLICSLSAQFLYIDAHKSLTYGFQNLHRLQTQVIFFHAIGALFVFFQARSGIVYQR
jgi:hypothetical protein